MTTPGPAQPPRFGRFDILDLIGKGGMAEVYRARIASGNRAGEEVALKRLLPELATDIQYVDFFTSEADLSRLLVHPNIVEVIEAGVVGDVYYMAMEFIDGRDLGAIMARCREKKILLPIDFCAFLTDVLVRALAYAHRVTGASGAALNVVHCDVSPSNMFISKLGEVKLGDFGIAKVRALDRGSSGLVWGKLSYLAPEQLTGGKLDGRTDLWAAGAVCYELLTNHKPFTGADADAIGDAILGQAPPPLRLYRPEIPAPLEQVVLHALEKEPSARFQTGEEFVAALKPLYAPHIGNPLAIASVVRNLFGA